MDYNNENNENIATENPSSNDWESRLHGILDRKREIISELASAYQEFERIQSRYQQAWKEAISAGFTAKDLKDIGMVEPNRTRKRKPKQK